MISGELMSCDPTRAEDHRRSEGGPAHDSGAALLDARGPITMPLMIGSAGGIVSK